MTKEQLKRRRIFIRSLAEYLSCDLARKSIETELGKPWAREWAKVRSNSPVSGWSTVDEAESELLEYFGMEQPQP